MKRLLYLLPVTLTLYYTGVFAQQEISPIITDRPDQTEAPATVPKGWFQIEIGGAVENDRIKSPGDEPVTYHNITYNTTLLKYGVTDRFELRLIQELLETRIQKETIAEGLSPLAIGMKISLLEEKGIIPQTSLIAHVNSRTGARDFKPSSAAPDFRFTFCHTLSDVFALSYNLGAEWNGEDAVSTAIYTLSLGISLPKSFGLFIELYGFLPEHQTSDHRFDAGFTYLLTNNLQLDVSGGLGISEISPDNFLSAGLSWRFRAN